MDDKLRVKMGKTASNVALIVNVSLMSSKVFIGIVSRSTAIIADAFNNGTDIFATVAVFGGLRVAYLPPDENHHYGHSKAEPIVSKIVAIIIMITGITIGWTSIKQILAKSFETPGFPAIVISVISIFAKYFLFKYTNRIGTTIGSSSIVADSYNHRSDVLASTSALLGVAGAKLGFPILDPAAGLIVSIIIFKTGISIYFDAISALMDTAPDTDTLNSIREKVLNTPGVISINDLRARKDGAKLHIDLKICVDKNISVEEGHKIASDAKYNISNNIENVDNILVHVNPCKNNRKAKSDCENCKDKIN